MFKFLKDDNKSDGALPVEDALREADTEGAEKTTGIETTLSIPEEWNLTDEETYVYSFHNSESPTLKVNQVSIYGMEYIRLDNEDVRITGLIRSTVTQTISFGEQTILLLDEHAKPIARKKFDLSKLGELPQNSARPWDFVFTAKDFIKQPDETPKEWSLAFKLETKHRLDLEESWERALDDKTKEQLAKIVADAAPLKEDEVNFLGFSAKHEDDGKLTVSVLIRNGNDRDITIEQLPLGIIDGSNEEVARGSFKLDDFVVKANTSKPWTFIFPADMVKKTVLDLSRWTAYVPQD